MPTREEYVAQRVGARFAERGEAMILRRISMVDGPVPYRNPPDCSDDLTVLTGITVAGQAYLSVGGSSVIGRLVPGDQIQTLDALGAVLVTWTVMTMPTGLQTDADGVPEAGPDGTPTLGTPANYQADSLAANDVWPVVPVSTPTSPDPAASIGQNVALVFSADSPVFGVSLTLVRMVLMGWTQVDTIGLHVAAYNKGPVLPAPKIDDQIIVDGQKRNIISLGDVSRRGVDFLYPIQAR